MKHHATTLLAIFFLLALTAPATASVRTGDRQFERAWLNLTSKQTDKAKAHFVQSAKAYDAALAEDPPSRTMLFPSTLLQAGMAFYYADQFEASIKAFNMTHRNKDNWDWEALLFMGLSQARLGDKEKTIKLFKEFREALSFQQKITTATTSQLKALEEGTTTLDAAADVIEQAIVAQFAENALNNRSPRAVAPPTERCDGRYWWRYNSRPCSASGYKWY